MLAVHGMNSCKPADSPFCAKCGVPEDTLELDAHAYARFRRTIGQGIFMITERPDLAYVVKELGRYASKPCRHHEVWLRRFLRYLQATSSYYLRLRWEPTNGIEIRGISDASWAPLPDRRSTTGWLICVEGVLVMRNSRTQPTISKSSCEAELSALDSVATESIHVATIVEEIGLKSQVELQVDASAVEGFLWKRGMGRMRHLQVKQLWLQDAMAKKRFILSRIDSQCNPADLLTKPMATARYHALRQLVGLTVD
jgi:hypothetical protein